MNTDALDTLTLTRDASLREAIAVIDRGGKRSALVVNHDGTFFGMVTEEDVRHGLLRGLDLDTPAERVCGAQAVVGSVDDSPEALERLMLRHGLDQVPVLDEHGVPVRLECIDSLPRPTKRDNLVVLMAGGKGRRLRPLTEACPKPLLKVGGRPILETIVESFLRHGFSNLAISVHYKAEMVKDHFGDGSAFGASITYLDETEPLGTGGSLALLPERPKEPFFVMNGDILTSVNFSRLLAFHIHHRALATMGVREYEMEVPYGVIELAGERIASIKEKPVERYFVNAGVYILSPRCLDYVPSGEFFDMPDLFQRLLSAGERVFSYPLRDYWMDIGRMGDFERARVDFGTCDSREDDGGADA